MSPPSVRQTASNSGAAALSPEGFSPSQQTKRLRLRNAGFRGPTLPARRVSPIFASSVYASDAFHRAVNDENSPRNVEKRLLYGEGLPPSPVTILQELHSSARRKRHSPPAELGTIFQDQTATEPVGGGAEVSWYNESSNNDSPISSNSTPMAMMKLKEASFNSKAPLPFTSPLMKQVKSRNPNRANARSTSSEANKYIEHLESQLAAVNTKLDSMMSPTAHKARASKLRAVTAEARSLRQDISDWEEKFDERVGEERRHLAEVEKNLMTRLHALEDEVEAKDNRIRELEWEVDTLRSKVKGAEGLETTNANLERRIDVLAGLVAQSPTKLDLSSAVSSPSKADPQKRTPRARSIMPRMPPSPCLVRRLSIASGSESQLQNSRRSFGSISSTSKGLEDPTQKDRRASETDLSQSQDPLGEKKESSDVSSGTSLSLRSAPTSSSRPTSLHSNGSFGTYSWGLPLPPDPDSSAATNGKNRRMRRFPSGSCSLKPLILPTSTGPASLPASASAQGPLSPTPRRDSSDISLDPAEAFLSMHEFVTPRNTPEHSERRASASYALKQTLFTLEGRPWSSFEMDNDRVIVSPKSFTDEPLATVEEDPSEGRGSRRGRPRSLEEELEQAELRALSCCEEAPIPTGPDSSTKHEVIPTSISPSQFCTPSQGNDSLKSSRAGTTPKPRSQPKVFPASPAQSPAVTSVATEHANGLFSRFKDLISRTKQDPPTLARRIIRNAWTTGISQLGGMGWWLLGLLYRSCWGKRKRAADSRTTVEDSSAAKLNWHCFSLWSDQTGTNERPNASEVAPTNQESGTGRLGETRQWTPITPLSKHHVRSHRAGEEPHLFPCPNCMEPSSRRTMRLWFRFTLAVVLAVGIAIKDGPGCLLSECYHTTQDERERLNETLKKPSSKSYGTMQSDVGGRRTPRTPDATHFSRSADLAEYSSFAQLS